MNPTFTETRFLASLGFRLGDLTIEMSPAYYRDDEFELCKTVNGMLFVYYPFKGIFQGMPDKSLTDPSRLQEQDAERLKANYDRHYAPTELRGGLFSFAPWREGDSYYDTERGMLRRETSGVELLYDAKCAGWLPITSPYLPDSIKPLTHAQALLKYQEERDGLNNGG